MKKTIFEIIGNFLKSAGGRFLFGGILAAVSMFIVTTLSVEPLGSIAAITFIFSIPIAVSILESTRSYFVKEIKINLPSGEVVPCVIAKQKLFAYLPVVPFISLFFYIPCNTQYFIIKNISATDFPEGARINDNILTNNLLNVEPINKKYAKKIIKNPQILENEISDYVTHLREEFCKDLKIFVDANLLEEVFFTTQFSICKTCYDEYIISHYSKQDKALCFAKIDSDSYEKLKENPFGLFGSYFVDDDEDFSIIELNQYILERIAVNSENENKNETQLDITSETLENIEKKKTLLTKEIIFNSCKSKLGLGNLVLGITIIYFDSLALMGWIPLIMFGHVFLGIITLLFGISMLYLAIKLIKKYTTAKRNLSTGNYKIIKLRCTNTLINDELNSFSITFANGHTITSPHQLGATGDFFYLVYVEGRTYPCAYFNTLLYTPTADLVIEDESN